MTSPRLAWLSLGCALLGCGDEAPVGNDSGSSSAATQATETADDTTTESSGSASVDSTGSSGGAPTTGADTSSTGGSSDASSSSAGSSDTGSSDTTGAGVCEPLASPGSWPCNDDGDCEIAGDCCGCTAYNPNMGAPGNCGGGCGQDVCEQLGLDTAVCVDNTCQVADYSCNENTITCDEEPPACDDGTLPQVADSGCWTGQCFPIGFCDWVPDCGACSADLFCVVVQTDDCDQHDCVPPIPECGGAPECDCFGEIVCPNAYPTCAVEDGAIVCS